MATSIDWQKVAAETQFALMGCFLRSNKDKDRFVYQIDQKGITARLIDKAIKELGEIAKRPGRWRFMSDAVTIQMEQAKWF